MNKEEWLELRKTKVTGTDAGVILKLNPWKSPYTLFCEKTDRVEPDDLESNEAVYWGTAFEPALLDRFNKEIAKNEYPDHGYLACLFLVDYFQGDDGDYILYDHPTRDWMACTPDAVSPTSVVELKTTRYQDPDEWISDPPKHYYAQLQHNIEVMEKDHGYLACLFLDKVEFRYAKFDRNDSFIKTMVEAERKFFDRITNDEWPDVDNSDSTGDTIKKLFPLADEEKEISVDGKFMETWDARVMHKESIKYATSRAKTMENSMKAEMKDAAFANFPDGRRISFKTTHRKGFQQKYTEPTSYRQFREVKQK